MAASAQGADARVPGPQTATLSAEVVDRALDLVSQAARVLAPAGARVLARPGRLDPRLNLAPCDDVQPFLGGGVPVWGASRVGLRCRNGPVAWQVFLPVTVEVWAPALVASGALPVGARLDSSVLTQAVVDWAAGGSPPAAASSELQDRLLARPVAAGQPFRRADLKARQWFAQGDTVEIRAVGTGFSVVTEGQALTPGLEGQPARVRTEAGRVVVAHPVGQRRVEVQL